MLLSVNLICRSRRVQGLIYNRLRHRTEHRNVINKDWSNVKTVQIIVEDKVWIGFGVTILKGVKIGEGAVIGAKSVVTRDVKPWTVVAGNPARLIKTIR